MPEDISGAGHVPGFGGSEWSQLFMWGVVAAFVSAVLQPILNGFQQAAWELMPTAVPPPADLADWVVRGIMSEEDATKWASKSGLDSDFFTDMARNAGEPPGLETVLQMWRRGFIQEGPLDPTKPTVDTAIATSRVYTYWTEAIKQNMLQPPSPSAVIDALLRNQISEVEAVQLAYQGGLGMNLQEGPLGPEYDGTQQAVEMLFNTSGNPPAVGELLDMVRRGFIPWGDLDPQTKTPNPEEISFAQGVFEGDNKDKWLPLYAKLAVVLPAIYEVREAESVGAMTAQQAQAIYEQEGYSADVATALSSAATQTKVATNKQLTVSQVLDLYKENFLDQDQLASLLGPLGYGQHEIDLLVAMTDLGRVLGSLNSAITHVGSLYVAYKITRNQAIGGLNQLGLPPQQVNGIIGNWDIERTLSVKQLTETQIADAFEAGLMTQDQSMTELESIGYQPYDAWVILSLKNKAALPNQPEKDATIPIQQV